MILGSIRRRAAFAVALLIPFLVRIPAVRATPPAIPTYPAPLSVYMDFITVPDKDGRFEVGVRIKALVRTDSVRVRMSYDKAVVAMEKPLPRFEGLFKAGQDIVWRISGYVKTEPGVRNESVVLTVGYVLPHDALLKASEKRYGSSPYILSSIKRDLERDKGKRQTVRKTLSVKKTAEAGIWEIRLERTMCLGTCPAYTVILRNDGRAEYFGAAYVEKKGPYSGYIDPYLYDMLVGVILENGFFDLEDNYTRPATDLPSAVTTVKGRDGKTKNIKNYGNAGPEELAIIERAIDTVETQIHWREGVY